MHASVMRWAEDQVGWWGLADRSVLEVGSFDVNGSVRPLFTGRYVGVDMRDGPGVDIVAEAADLPFGDEQFEVVVCTEMLEHDATFWLSMAEMSRVLVPNGLLLLSCRGNGFPHHEYPFDFYRFSPEAISVLFALNRIQPLRVVPDEDANPGVLASGRKRVL